MEHQKGHVLLVDGDVSTISQLEAAFEAEGFNVSSTDSAANAVNLIKTRSYDLVVSEAELGEMTGVEIMRMARIYQPDTEVILLSETSKVKHAVEAMHSGAYYYLEKPVDIPKLLKISQRAAKPDQTSQAGVGTPRAFDNIIGATPEMLYIFDMVKKVATSKAPILIQGESGTGKQLIAEAIHRSSNRSSHKFMAVNADSLPEEDNSVIELLQSANRGTLFLEEISSMPKPLQNMLLNALEQMEAVPSEEPKPGKIDVRILSSSARDLKQMVKQGEFREDLYYRLSVIEINVPPLKDRFNDLPLLVNYFVREYCRQNEVPAKSLSRAALKRLYEHHWPGNVGELEKVVNRAVVTSDSRTIQPEDMLIQKPASDDLKAQNDIFSMQYDDAVRTLLDDFQQEYLRRHFDAAGGNISLVARRTGVTRQTLYNLMRRHNFKRGDRKLPVITP
jgi:DNA-binding NtrC family response regulator